MTVVIADKLSDKAISVFKTAGIEVDDRPSRGEIPLDDVIGEAKALVIRSSTKVSVDLLKKAPNLKVVGRAGIGVDNVDLNAATQAGVLVMNTPFGNSVTTAEHAIALLLSLVRHIPQANLSTREGKWEKSSFKGSEVFQKTLGVIGCGNIGAIVANRARGLQMKVITFDPFLTDDRAKQIGVQKVTLDELCAQSDFITLHVPLLDDTKHLFDEKRLRSMKKGAYIVNAARGGLIKEDDLDRVLNDGHLAGAALDVFEKEPARENVLFSNPKVIVTPHLGASTNEAQENVAEQVAEQITDYLKTGEIRNAINYPSLSREDVEEVKPHLALATQLGALLGQMTNAPIKTIKLDLHGQAADLNSKPLLQPLVSKILSYQSDNVNPINALGIAKQKGIEINCNKFSGSSDYQTLVKVSIVTDLREFSASGSLFNGLPRLTQVHNMPLEVTLDSSMIYIRNKDVPGVIGKVGKVLADANYNIKNYHLASVSSVASEEEAISLISIEKPLDSNVIQTLQALPEIERVLYLAFDNEV